MAQQNISTGTTPGDGTGDSLPSAFAKVNANFEEVYDKLGELDEGKAAASHTQTALDAKLNANDASVTNARTPTGGAGGVLSGTFPNPGFAVDMATQAELDAVAAAKANASHTHAQSDVTGLVSDLAGKAAASHTHAQSDITGLVSDLAGKAATSHTHALSALTQSGATTGQFAKWNGSAWAPADAAGGGLAAWLIKTANYTAAAGDRIQADSSSGAFTITLPATPSEGNEVWIEDGRLTWNTNNVTLDRNGQSINGAAANLDLDVSGDSAKAVFITGFGWSVK